MYSLDIGESGARARLAFRIQSLSKRHAGLEVSAPGRRPSAALSEIGGSAPYLHLGPRAFDTESEVKLNPKAAILALAMVTAGCTDLKPLEARIDELQSQVNQLQADMAKSANIAAAANKATAASASAASSDAKQALSIGEANTAAIDKLNAKIDQMFRKRPAE
jgi:outer membrane murein-binding lipoprotein Lpp